MIRRARLSPDCACFISRVSLLEAKHFSLQDTRKIHLASFSSSPADCRARCETIKLWQKPTFETIEKRINNKSRDPPVSMQIFICPAAPRDQEGLLPSRAGGPTLSRTCIEVFVPPSNVERYKGCKALWLIMRSRARAARTLRPTPGPTSTAVCHLRSAAPPAVPSPCALARLPTAPRWRSRVSPVLSGLSSCGCVICSSFLFGSLPQRLLDLHYVRSSRLS